MSSTFVTLAEVLEARGGPLLEDEVWSLLLGTAESLVDVSYKGHNSKSTIISPSSLLLSATGTLAFKNCALSDEVTTFTAPEMLQGRASSTKPAMEKMLVYSLGMTLYWSVDYHLPQNQPVPLSDHLNCLLLSMCEDLSHRRVTLNSILEACESQHKASLLPPPNKVIRQLVEDVFHDSVDQGSPQDNIAHLSGRSQMIRERLHGKRGPYPDYTPGAAADFRRYSEDSNKSGSLPHRPWKQSSPIPSYPCNTDRLPRGLRHRDSSCSSLYRSPYLDVPPKPSPTPAPKTHSPSITFSESSLSLSQRKTKTLGPEFVRMAEEQQIILELPGSIVSKKGRSCVSQREVSVVMPSGQVVAVRCDIKSRGRDVFDMVVAHANLVEHFYFGLAFIDDDEFFFLDHETKISKVAPDSWKKAQSTSFLVYLRVKFFVEDISFILHRLTRHQYYLQLRKDILEDRLHCNEETGLFLAALALQAEFGEYMPELYGKDYYQPEHYVSKRMLERMAFPSLKEELPRLHANHSNMLPEDAETEYLKIAQQLPEYGVLFHRVGREKKPVVGELVLGVCARGIIVYEMKNHLRSVTRRFLWRETDSISTGRRKLTVECGGPSGKKHSFMTESSKIAQYLLSLCSAQHKFYSEMTSRQLNHSTATQGSRPGQGPPGGGAGMKDDNMEKYLSICRSRNSHMKRLSCSEGGINLLGLGAGQPDVLSKSCDDLSAKMEARLRQQRELRELNRGPEPRELGELRDQKSWSSTDPLPRITSHASLCKQDSLSTTSSIRVDTPTRGSPEREIICVTLKKDLKLGFGFVMVGEDNSGKLDLGIFIASIVPDGPADRDGRIRPGGRLISLNKISLEGVTFTDAAAILQSSPDEVELIVSQPKFSLRDSKTSLAPSGLGRMLERGFGSQSTLSGTEFRPAMEELEEALALSNMATPKHGKRLHVPVVRILDAQEVLSRSSSICSLRFAEQLSVELRKTKGSLGISVAGGVNTSVRYGSIYIKSLVLGGAAEQDGRIQIGDRLLEVDGFNLRGVTHKQAVECLKRTGEVVSLLLEREPNMVFEPGADSPRPHSAKSLSQPSRAEVSMETSLNGRAKDYSFMTDENTHEVVLKKNLSGLGFSFFISELTSGPDRGTVVRVKWLFDGQPAKESGQIQQGDVILAVNGEPVKDQSYQRVLSVLRGAQSEVSLLICRPPPGTLPDLDTNTLSPSRSPTRDVRSRSLDIRLTEDYSQLLKRTEESQADQQPCQAQEEASSLGTHAEVPFDPHGPLKTQQSQESQDSEPFPSPPPAPSPPSPGSHESPHSPPYPRCSSDQGKKEDEDEDASRTSVMRLRRSSYLKASANPTYASGIRKEADGRHTYCLMGNGLTILADEEYLTISSTSLDTISSLPAHTPPPPEHTPGASLSSQAPSQPWHTSNLPNHTTPQQAPQYSRTPSTHSHTADPISHTSSARSQTPDQYSNTPSSHSPTTHSHTPDQLSHTPAQHSHTPDQHSHTPDQHSHTASTHSQTTSTNSYTPDQHSHTASTHSQTTSTNSYTPDQHSQTPSTHSHTASTHSHAPTTHSYTPDQHSQTPSTNSHTASTHSHAPTTHSNTPDQHSNTPDQHSHTASTHSHTPDQHSHTASTHSHAPDQHSHTASTHSHTASTHSHAPDQHSHTASTHSHTPDQHSTTASTHSHTASTHSHAPTTHSHTPDQHSHTPSPTANTRSPSPSSTTPFPPAPPPQPSSNGQTHSLSHPKTSSKHTRPLMAPPLPPTPQPPPQLPPAPGQAPAPGPPCLRPPVPTLPDSQAAHPSHSHTHWRDEEERVLNDDDDDDEEEDPRRGMLKEFELSVVLTKSRSGSFGFTITRSKIDGCYYIQEILDSPAKADGRLRAGDRLITVHGQDVTNVTDEFAMAVLRMSQRRLSMTLGRAVSNLVAPPPPDSLNDVVLHKTPSGQLGIKLTGGIGSKWQGIYCLEVVPGSPASEEGSVQPNDKIIYICGKCTLGMTLEDAVKVCEMAPRKVKLKILRDDQPLSSKVNKWNGLFDWKKDRRFFTPRFEEPSSPEAEEEPEPVSRPGRIFRPRFSITTELDSCILQVEFTKPEGGGLGFALVGGANGSALRVKDICPGGVAEQDGRLRVGDILLEVNEVIVSGLSHSKVVDILRRAEGTVQLTICRDILPSPGANMAAQPGANMAAQPGANMAAQTETNMTTQTETNMTAQTETNMAAQTETNMAAQPGANMAAQPGANMAAQPGANMAAQPGANMAADPVSQMAADPGASKVDEATLESCSNPDIQQRKLKKPSVSFPSVGLSGVMADPLLEEEEDFIHRLPPQYSHHIGFRAEDDAVDGDSCSSTPSHGHTCCPSLRVSDILHGASDRNPPLNTILLDQPTKDSRNSQSDGWSSEEEEDDAFESNGQDITSPLTGPPIVSEEELASLALISPSRTSQYSGSRVKALIQILQHQLDQQELVKEFMTLEHLKPSDNCLVGKAAENRDKNRYRDILPYDQTRVPLGENQDYINASYIHMEVGTKDFYYISCQGPLPSTVPAFWQMVWENKSDVIAMMTQEVERGRVKCHRYWPERVSSPLDAGRYQLFLENRQQLEYFHIKILRIVEKETGDTHLVRHLKFTCWPDHGVPRCSEQLVRFIRYLRAVHHKGPAIVHCSAGIGRTGVLLCTDVILSLIENDLPINVSDIVKEMRLQRYGMIQTKEQYLFCYKVWLEVLQGILQLHSNQWQPESPHDHHVV